MSIHYYVIRLAIHREGEGRIRTVHEELWEKTILCLGRFIGSTNAEQSNPIMVTFAGF
jgi:hypothetical protein